MKNNNVLVEVLQYTNQWCCRSNTWIGSNAATFGSSGFRAVHTREKKIKKKTILELNRKY